MSDPLADLAERLAERLKSPLPGPMVGSRFEPCPRWERHYDSAPPDARQAAVLVLFYPRQNRWHIPLTERPTHLPDHAGQISLPGGAIEPGEASYAAAVREFHEELGASGLPIRPIGRLSPIYVHASNFRVEPWIGLTEQCPDWSPNRQEVETLLEIPVEHLLDPASLSSHRRKHRGQEYTAPHFVWQTYRIWGATCMILGELVTLLSEMR